MLLSSYDVVITKGIQDGRLILNIFIHGWNNKYKTSFRVAYDNRLYHSMRNVVQNCEYIVYDHMIIYYMVENALKLSSKEVKCHVETYMSVIMMNDYVIDVTRGELRDSFIKCNMFRCMNKKVTDLNNLMLLKISKAGGIIDDPRFDFK